MPSIPKPNSLSLIWAAQGTKTAPEPDKINQGWVVELPPYQTANYIENKQDQFIAHGPTRSSRISAVSLVSDSCRAQIRI